MNVGAASEGGVIAGVDVGGTFTDIVVVDRAKARVAVAKVPTTPENQAAGVLAALERVGVDLAHVDLIVHGTTTTTNAILERKLARTGMITTRGFRDVIEVGRRTRPQAYGMFGVFRPVIPRDLRLEVSERMDADGEVVRPLAESEVAQAVDHLRAKGCEAIVVHFLHAYANPAHERRAVEIALERWPDGHVTAGHQLLSEFREFERGVTAAVNAAVQPILHRYVGRLQQELSARGFRRELLVMNGNGGMVSADRVAAEAAKTVMSGPASGVMAAAYTAKRAGLRDVITYDMGGTSTDVSLIRDALPPVSHELEIEYALPIHVPMVDVRTIGAGGGSIARIDEAGLLQVGPESAGAEPGPVCYGQGGTQPTISDAHFVLGRLNPARLLAGSSGVTPADVRRVVLDKIGRPLGLDADEAAAAIIRIADTQMAGAIRMVSIGKGHDPRDFALIAFGGGGPLHAVSLARELGIPRVLVPSRPGLVNALGCVVADVRHDFVNTVNKPLDIVHMAEVHRIFAEQIAEGERLIAAEPVSVEATTVSHTADMQFIGQTHILSVDLPRPGLSRDQLQTLFERAYHRRFRVELPEIRANLVNLNTSVVGRRPDIDLSILLDPGARAATLDEARTEVRPVHFDRAWHDTPVYARDALPAGVVLDGPAIVEQLDTTIVIDPGARATSDGDGNLIIEVGR